MDAREKRLVENETIFREINERIAQLATSPQPADEHVYEFLCECSNSDCTLQLPLTVHDYAQARRDPRQFIVARGHELPEIEKVVFRTPGYEVVRKTGEEPGRPSGQTRAARSRAQAVGGLGCLR